MDLADILVEEGVAAPRRLIKSVLEGAAESGVPAPAALIDRGIIDEELLADVLARAAGTIVIQLDEESVEADSRRLIPEKIARQRLALALSRAGGRIRVAFANPLDEAGRAEVESALGEGVQPVVALLGVIRTAIDREYTSRATRVIKAKDGDSVEMEVESTAQVRLKEDATSPGAPQVDTLPISKLEAEATAEQRHEALLLALVERGVLTRADYHAALKRLLSGRRRS